MTTNYKELIEATKDLMNQLEGIGIYMPGEDEGQWIECEGLSFKRIENALSISIEQDHPIE